jgi:hypothetical protein
MPAYDNMYIDGGRIIEKKLCSPFDHECQVKFIEAGYRMGDHKVFLRLLQAFDAYNCVKSLQSGCIWAHQFALGCKCSLSYSVLFYPIQKKGLYPSNSVISRLMNILTIQ